MCTARLCASALCALRNKRDAIFMTSETTPLPARPLNHLSVLAYLAIGIVVFASSVVTGYLIHSCYRSASRKDSPMRSSRTQALEDSMSVVDVESGAMIGRRGWRDLELKPLAREFSSDKESLLSDNKTVIGHSSFDKDRPPHLAYSSDSPAASLRLLAPQSPSPAHKQQMQYTGQPPYSPVSPSPSFFPDVSAPYTLTPYRKRNPHAERENTRVIKSKTKRKVAPGIQFDSNNIRYVPPLDPRVTESTVVNLYNEPKLSPVHGSIVPSSTPVDSPLHPSHGRKPSFLQDAQVGVGVARLGKLSPSSAYSTPVSKPQSWIRVISGETSGLPTVLPRVPESLHEGNAVRPIHLSSQRVENQAWEPTLPTVRLKPGPGFF